MVIIDESPCTIESEQLNLIETIIEAIVKIHEASMKTWNESLDRKINLLWHRQICKMKNVGIKCCDNVFPQQE